MRAATATACVWSSSAEAPGSGAARNRGFAEAQRRVWIAFPGRGRCLAEAPVLAVRLAAAEADALSAGLRGNPALTEEFQHLNNTPGLLAPAKAPPASARTAAECDARSARRCSIVRVLFDAVAQAAAWTWTGSRARSDAGARLAQVEQRRACPSKRIHRANAAPARARLSRATIWKVLRAPSAGAPRRCGRRLERWTPRVQRTVQRLYLWPAPEQALLLDAALGLGRGGRGCVSRPGAASTDIDAQFD